MAANLAEMTGLEADSALIRNLCKFARKAPSALATSIGVAATTMTRPYKGTATTRLSQPVLDKLKAKYPDFPGWRREHPDQQGMHGERIDPNERPDELVYVREVDISYSMGDGAVIEDYPAVGLIPFNISFIRAISRSSTDRLFISAGHGESMEPTLLRSDLLMIDTTKNRIAENDHIWALSYAGAGMVKRVRRQRGDQGDELVILSDNPSVPPQVAPADEVFVIGKVIWVGRRM